MEKLKCAKGLKKLPKVAQSVRDRAGPGIQGTGESRSFLEASSFSASVYTSPLTAQLFKDGVWTEALTAPSQLCDLGQPTTPLCAPASSSVNWTAGRSHFGMAVSQGEGRDWSTVWRAGWGSRLLVSHPPQV